MKFANQAGLRVVGTRVGKQNRVLRKITQLETEIQIPKGSRNST